QLRKSNLGLEIPGLPTKLVCTLFADDTLVYMHYGDSHETLQTIISHFCEASTARFNTEKTEYLPLGSKPQRTIITSERRVQQHAQPLPANLKLLRDGEALRTLGAWVGYNVNVSPQWNTILKKIENTKVKWTKMRPTLQGRRLLANSLLLSRGWYLATVNGIQPAIYTQLRKLIHSFLWNDQRAPI
ncbi:hypothetical protein CALCODRAFT_414211, partial [Calocera cornea HHB12733]